MSSKPKSAVSETPKRATPRVSKVSRGVDSASSPSPLQSSSRLSVDRSSPRSVNSIKPATRSPKIAATPPPSTPQKQPSGGTKGSELLAQLTLVQEDLKKTKEQIELIEKDKAKAIDDLKEAQKVSDEANVKELIN